MEKVIEIQEWTMDDFIQFFGDAYICRDYCDDEYSGYIREKEYEKSRELCLSFREQCMAEDTRFSMSLEDYFEDDEMWISEWIYCQERHHPFVYHEEDEHGNELIFQLVTGEEFYNFLMRVKNEKLSGTQKYRY